MLLAGDGVEISLDTARRSVPIAPAECEKCASARVTRYFKL
jgi:hypothetical protein